MSQNVNDLVQAAGQSANAGRWLEAEQTWKQVLDIAPDNPQALCSLGIHALHRGDNNDARAMLSKARVAAPDDFVVLMALSNACRQLGDVKGERDAVDAALDVDAYFLPAHLARADWIERFGSPVDAAAAYRHTLAISPPEDQWPDDFRPRLAHAREVVRAHANALGTHLGERLSDLSQSLEPEASQRWQEAISIRAGLTQPYSSHGNQLHIPRLPSIPFFERNDFPVLADLERKTDAIRTELLNILRDCRQEFVPYIKYNTGDPVNQWQELNHSDRWSALHLWQGGTPVRENLERCPETASALLQVQMADINGLCPNALFSALSPKTHIPPHNGETNARLVAHLPLIVPDGCVFRVGFEERQWRVGECLIFDDTIEHEARNDSDDLRVILIFDLWNPLLSETEQRLASELARSTREFSP